jgi:hypothetical protein
MHKKSVPSQHISFMARNIGINISIIIFIITAVYFGSLDPCLVLSPSITKF